MKILESPAKRFAVVITLATLNLSVLADQTWKGTSDNLWPSTGNWSGSAIPGSTDLVIYNASSTGNLSNWLSQAFSIKGISFTNPASPVSLNNSGITLTLGTSGINMTNCTQPMTISMPVALGGGQTWSVATNQTLSIGGAVSGSGTLLKSGGGVLYLNATSASF